MKKIGTLTTAVAFIFYGIWLIIKNVDYNLSMYLLKFWPLIFILLGVEILYFSRKAHLLNVKPSVNYFIILVVMMFLCTSLYYNVKDKALSFAENRININEKSIKNALDNGGRNMDFSVNGSKAIDSKKTLESYGKELNIDLPNAKIDIQNSDDNKISMDFQVYVDKSESIKSYEITSDKEKDGYKVSFPQSFVNGVKGTIYVPKDYYVKLNGSNMDIYAKDFNGDVDIDGSNCNINLQGDIKNSIMDISNGKISLKNNVCENIKIDTSNASVNIDTKDRNIKVKADIGNGVCKLNGEKRVNSGISKTLGNGEGNIEVDTSNGVVNIKSGE